MLLCVSNSALATEDPLVPSIQEFQELLIVHPRVVDPYLNGGRSHNGGAHQPGGSWSFRSLIEDAARQANGGQSPSQAFLNQFMKSLLQGWLSDQTVNGQALPARDANRVASLLLDVFSTPTPSDAPLSAAQDRDYQLWNAPFELIAIANRMDLRAADGSDGGELRFVYKLNPPDAGDQKFTLILEYKVPTDTWSAVTFAHEWHVLGSLPLGSEEYLEQLEYITNHVTKWPTNATVFPGRLAAIRTNEIAFAPTCDGCPPGVWEMREFHRDQTGLFVPAQVFNSPPQVLNGTTTLADFLSCYPALSGPINSEADFTVPARFDSCPGAAGITPPNVDLLGVRAQMGPDFAWKVRGPNGLITQHDSQAVDNLGFLSCNGCHNENKSSSDRAFYHIDPELLSDDVSQLADGTGRLSLFLTQGRAVAGSDPVPELLRRKRELAELLTQNSTDQDFQAGNVCTDDSVCRFAYPYPSTCQNGYCREALHCRNWSFDEGQGEGGPDCGGDCRLCATNQACIDPSDCNFNSIGLIDCVAGTCRHPTCSDQRKNGKETDIDCGGTSCSACPIGKLCTQASDCVTGNCVSGRCQDYANCVNNTFDSGLESGLDCGGHCTKKCGLSAGCASNADCGAALACGGGICISTACAAPNTTDFDHCTGLRRSGAPCSAAAQCQSGLCQTGTCVQAATCAPPPGWPDADQFVASGLTYGDGSCGGIGCDTCGSDAPSTEACSAQSGCQFGSVCDMSSVTFGNCVPAPRVAGETCVYRMQCQAGLDCVGSRCVRP
jgi:hypothetical protein